MKKRRSQKQTVTTKREPISRKQRFDIFNRDHFTCQYCGQKSPAVVLHVDHITPVAKGGSNECSNLITACSSCNSGKSTTELIVKTKKQYTTEIEKIMKDNDFLLGEISSDDEAFKLLNKVIILFYVALFDSPSIQAIKCIIDMEDCHVRDIADAYGEAE